MILETPYKIKERGVKGFVNLITAMETITRNITRLEATQNEILDKVMTEENTDDKVVLQLI